MKMVVTGGRGFIGSHFVELALLKGHTVIDIDKMTYCASKNLSWDHHQRYSHIADDIAEIKHIPFCDVIVNFAAETHVDNSITYCGEFVKSNIQGVYNILELLRGKVYERPMLVQISTDEVYGDTLHGDFKEAHTLKPSNPYSATKASAEHLVTSYHRTYGIDYLITRSSNNYGPRQYEEKLIAKSVSCLSESRKIPLHGDGSYIRDWIFVKDNVKAIMDLIESGVKNETFNIAGGLQLSNSQVVEQVCGWFGLPDWNSSIMYTENRLGQDLRYSISCDKIRDFGIEIPRRESLIDYRDLT
jgi:dTDP-glucose 4,6-dehydratase